MTYEKGNQLYKLRVHTGAYKKYATAAALAKKCNEYFEWIENNPDHKPEVINRPWTETIIEYRKDPKNGEEIKVKRKLQHTHTIIQIPVKKPYTFEGLCNFLKISTETFKNYQADADKFEVCTQARLLIDQHQFEGAASGFFKEQIIARKLGLTDRKDITSGGEALSQVTIFELPDNGRDPGLNQIGPATVDVDHEEVK